MLYIIKRSRDSHYLSLFDDTHKKIEFEFSPFISDALQLPRNIAEQRMKIINEIEPDKYEIVSVK